MLCCGCKKNPHALGGRTQLLDPSVSNNYLYHQQHQLHLQQAQSQANAAAQAAQAAAIAAAGQMAGAMTPQLQLQQGAMQTSGLPPGTVIATATPAPGLIGVGGQQRYVGGLNYVMAQQHPMYHQTIPGGGGRGACPGGPGGYLANSNTGIFGKPAPASALYSSMIFPQGSGPPDGRQSRLLGGGDLVSLQPGSFRRVSGISTEVFRQIEAVEAQFDATQTLSEQYAEMERRGEMIIRILNPTQLLPGWLEDTCRRYGDGHRLPSWVQFVEVIKRPGQTLGLYIREGDALYTNDGVYISRIALESPVYQSGCLRVGDEVLAINMVDVQRMSLDDVVILMSIPRRLILTIRSRPLNATVDHLLPGLTRMYGSESYYDTVPGDIYSRVEELRANKPVVVLKQSHLDAEEAEAAAEEAEAEAEHAAAVEAALDAATVAAEVGLLDAAEIAAASVEQQLRDGSGPLVRRHARSGSLHDVYGGLKGAGPRVASRASLASARKLFTGTADNLTELAMADAAYAYARRTGSLAGYGSMDRPGSRLGARSALLQAAKKGAGGVPGSTGSLYQTRLSSRARSATGRLLRTSSDLYLAQGPDDLMDRALLQSALAGSSGHRRHSLADTGADDAQMDYFLQRYKDLRALRGAGHRRPASLDRAYKSSLRNSFSNQTLNGGMGPPAAGLAQRRLESILAARGGRGGRGHTMDAYSDTEAYDTPASLLTRRAMTPTSLLDPGSYPGRSSSLPRGAMGPGGAMNARTEALNARLAQLEQFYAATAAAARRHTLTGGGGPGSRPQSALAGHYSDREEHLDPGFDPLGRRDPRLAHRPQQAASLRGAGSQQYPALRAPSRSRDDSALLQSSSAKMNHSRPPPASSTSAIYENLRKSKQAAHERSLVEQARPAAREPIDFDDPLDMAHLGPSANGKTATSLPRYKHGYGGDERTREINQELNARFASRHGTSKDETDYDLVTSMAPARGSGPSGSATGPSASSGGATSGGGPVSRPLMIDPSGFQQYGPELRAAAERSHRVDESAGYSGLLVIHLLGVRGLTVDGAQPGAILPAASTPERNLYCVVECDRVYKARTIAVQSHDSNSAHFDWDEIFDIDLFDTKEVTFLFYTWNPTSRHKLCSKGTIHLPWIATLRSQHVHAFEMRLYETPGAMLYIKLEFHDLRTTFKRTKRDPKATRRGSRSGGGTTGPLTISTEHPLFGVDLDTVLARENSGFSVPILIKRCTEEIEARGLHLVGIYRLCGSAIRKKNLRENFEKNSWLADLTAESVPDINVITSK